MLQSVFILNSLFRFRPKKLFDPRVISLYLSYSIGLIVPVIMGVVLYIQSSNLAEKEYRLFLEKEFTSTSLALSEIVNEIDFITTLAKLNTDLTNLTKTVAPDFYARTGYYDLYREQVFASVPIIQHYIREFQFIFPHNNIAIGSTGVSSLESLYNFETALTGYTLEEFLMILKQEQKGVPLNKYNVISIPGNRVKSQTLIINSFLGEAQFPGIGLFILNDENIMSTLLDLNLFIDGIVYLADSTGRVFYFCNLDLLNIEIINEPETIEDIQSDNFISGNLIHYQKNFADLGFILGTAVSKQTFRQKTSYIRNIIVSTIFVLIIINVIMLIIVSVIRARHLSRLLDTIQTEIQSSEDPEAITYKNIDVNLKKLLLKKQDLEEELNQSKPVMISFVLNSLIHGNLILDKDNQNSIERAGLSLNADFRSCFIIQYSAATELLSEDVLKQFLVKKMMINEFLKENITGNFNYLEQGGNRITFIHEGWGVSKEIYYDTLIRELKKAILELNTQLDLNIIAGVGNPYLKLKKIHQSYEEAALCLENFSQQPLVEYKQLATSGKKIYYSFETEIKLMNLIKEGKEEDIRNILEVLKKKNFQDQTLPPLKIAVFYNQIKATISKLEQILDSDQPIVQEKVNQFLSTNFDIYKWDLFYEEFEALVPFLSREFTNSLPCRKSSIDRTEVEEYLQRHFSDCTLSLSSFADHFNVTEKYFSKYFKEKIGINFHTYLENIRLNFIREQLENKELSLKDLMKSAGYVSQRTFTRAFKKKYGKSPSLYRNTIQQTFLYPD